jgi:hypothetical protein
VDAGNRGAHLLLSAILIDRAQRCYWFYPGKPRQGQREQDIRYFSVVILLIEGAQLMKLSWSTPEMRSVSGKMFFRSTTGAQ